MNEINNDWLWFPGCSVNNNKQVVINSSCEKATLYGLADHNKNVHALSL